MIVVDASVVVGAIAGDGEDARVARGRMAREDGLLAPELLDLEVVSAVRRAVRSGRIGAARGEAGLHALARLPIVRAGHGRLIARIWQLRDALSPYDAAYVALAEGLGLPLVTADRRIVRAGAARCPVEVLAAA